MRVIHGVWARGALRLWGEDPDRSAAPRGRDPAPAPHPFAALTSTDARLDGAAPGDEGARLEAAELAAELDAWLASARIPGQGSGPVRTCFRLTEPASEQDVTWRVEFALQSTDDPSLIVSDADTWAGQGLEAGGYPVEELLALLGAAARLFGELEDALRKPAPVVVELHTPGASEGCLACW
jgi:hypothetical protein